jgi:hypothetical protein
MMSLFYGGGMSSKLRSSVLLKSPQLSTNHGRIKLPVDE